MQIENLQKQLQAFAAQRDRAVMDLTIYQEQADQYQTSLNNLQLVLEQFQRGKVASRQENNPSFAYWEASQKYFEIVPAEVVSAWFRKKAFSST